MSIWKWWFGCFVGWTDKQTNEVKLSIMPWAVYLYLKLTRNADDGIECQYIPPWKRYYKPLT